MTEESGTNRKTISGYVGWTIHGLWITGTAAFILGIYLLFPSQDGIGTGVCWIATALCYGQLLNGLLRR